jgi:hypothetical protein
MLFIPLNKLKLDSPAIKTRKRLTHKHSEWIQDLKPDAIII